MPNTSKLVEIDHFREKLIELIEQGYNKYCNPNIKGDFFAVIADHLIASDFFEELQNEAYDVGVDSALHNHFGLSWEDAAGLRKEIKRLQDAARWIPVTERLPEDDLPKDTKRRMIRCLVYTDKGTVKPCVRQRWEHFDGKMQPWMWNKDLYAKPTHWMLMPQPPKGE